MKKLVFYCLVFVILTQGCKTYTFSYYPPPAFKIVDDPCAGSSECIISHIEYNDCNPNPVWVCCPTDPPIAHSITGGIGFENNTGNGTILMKSDSIGSNGCLDYIDLKAIFHISIAVTDTSLIRNDTVTINSFLFRNGQEISISPLYRVQSEMNSLATVETDTISSENYVIECKNDTLTANILADYGLLNYTKNSGGGLFHLNPKYELVVYIKDIHDLDVDEYCNISNPTTLAEFKALKEDNSQLCHLKEHILIIPIPFCDSFYSGTYASDQVRAY